MIARAGAALAAGLVLAAAGAPAARAEAVSAAELRTLAARAAGDPGALARLKRVDSVDGRRVDIAASLEGAGGEALRARLDALAAPSEDARAPSAAAARADARELLAQRRFRGTQLRGPFRGLLERVGGWLGPIRDLVPTLDRGVPGGRALVWVLLAATIALLAWAFSRSTVRRRAALAAAGGGEARGPRGEGPSALERRAAEAERRGEHAEAVRLRFRAGLLRLDARGTIEFRASMPTWEVARALGSEDFDRLASAFDEVVYGHRPAVAEDAEAARRGWSSVLAARR